MLNQGCLGSATACDRSAPEFLGNGKAPTTVVRSQAMLIYIVAIGTQPLYVQVWGFCFVPILYQVEEFLGTARAV